jgi:surface antigen
MGNDPWYALNEDHENRGNRPGRPLLTMTRFLAVLLFGLVGLAGAARAGEDPRDAAVVAAMVKQTLEFERTGTDLPWSNPETGSRGVIRVERTYNLDSDTPCRDYIRTTRRPDGEKSTTRGTGCRMGDGRWFLDEAPGAEVAPASKTPPAAAKAPEGRKDETAAASPSAAPKAEAAAPAVPAGGDEAEAKVWGDPAGEAAAEAYAPAPPRAKPKVPAPDYTLPSRSAL